MHGCHSPSPNASSRCPSRGPVELPPDALDRLTAEEGAAASKLGGTVEQRRGWGLLRGVIAASPFLTDLMVRDPDSPSPAWVAPEDSLAEPV
jgi:hypothetical protein